MKKNYYTIPIILYVLLSSFLMLECPSGRQKSRKERVSAAPTITPAEKAQPVASSEKLQPIVQGPTTPKPAIAQKVGTAALKPVTNPEPQTTQSNRAIHDLDELFHQKLEYSSNLTKYVIEYVFKNVFNELKESSNPPDKKKLEKIKSYFYALRYPIYRHLREVISACSDPNAFLCGGIIRNIARSNNNDAKKKAFFSAFNRIGAQLKNFKFYQIDNKLDEELEEHLGKLNEINNGENTLEIEKKIIYEYYIQPLTKLQQYIKNPNIKAILPPRESTAYYAYRTGLKKVKSAGSGLAKWFSKKAEVYAAKKLLNYFNSLAPKNLTIAYTTQTPGSIVRFLPLKGIEATLGGLQSTWQKPEIILDGLKSLSTITKEGTWNGMKNFASYIGSGILNLTFSLYEAQANQIIKGTFPFVIETALSIIKGASKPKITSDDLNAVNLNFMTKSAEFVTQYTQDLCNAIVKDKADIHRTTTALQSAQIELYRHRRMIISELSNPHALTYNYLKALHDFSAKKFITEIYQSIVNAITEIHVEMTEEQAIEKADKILKKRNADQNSIFNIHGTTPLNEDDTKVLDALKEKPSTDNTNSLNVMYFATPFKFEVMLNNFEAHRKKIIEELKSFGARSKYQLIQNYWLSVIDQSYPNNLQKHLEAIKADLQILMNEANYTISRRDQDWDIYAYSDGEPIKIPAPKVPPQSAIYLEAILTNLYIKPLEKIAKTLQQEDIFKKLPANKSWYLRYPIYATKANIGLQKQVISSVINELTIENIIAAAKAYATGGASASADALLNSVSISSVALNMLDIDNDTGPSSTVLSKVPEIMKQYNEGKGVTEAITDIVKKSGPVKKLGSALRAHERISRSY